MQITQMNTTYSEASNRAIKSAQLKMHEQIERQMRPLHQIEDIQNLAKRHTSNYQVQELLRQFEPLYSSAATKHFQDILGGASFATLKRGLIEEQSLKDALAARGLDSKTIRQTTVLNKSMMLTTDLDLRIDLVKQYDSYLKPISQHQELLEHLDRQSFGGVMARDLVRQLVGSNSAFSAIEEARKSLDRLLPTFLELELKGFEPSADDDHEVKVAAKVIIRTSAEQESIQKAFDCIVTAIEAQQKPTVQLMLFWFFRKLLDWLIAGAIGAAMGYYAPGVLGDSPQAAKKAIHESARVAVGSLEILADYRYVSIKVLIVRRNPCARSSEVGNLPFGRVVKLLKKEKDFSLVIWTDKDTDTEIQGWVFSRYLGKFK
jgi:hypothetical protein